MIIGVSINNTSPIRTRIPAREILSHGRIPGRRTRYSFRLLIRPDIQANKYVNNINVITPARAHAKVARVTAVE